MSDFVTGLSGISYYNSVFIMKYGVRLSSQLPVVLRVALPILGHLWFYMDFGLGCFISVKSTVFCFVLFFSLESQ